MSRFFLSHSTPDKPLVLPVDQVLKALGLSVWTDKFEIKAGESLVTKIFDEGLDTADYVCVFLTAASVRSRWVREELEFAFVRATVEGKPQIIVLQFDEAPVPNFLKSRRYASVQRHELGAIVREITAAAGIPIMNHNAAPIPYAANDFHDAIVDGAITFLLASKADELDFDPYFDPEGIVFKRRHLYVIRVDGNTGQVAYHYLSRARPTHTAMRVIGDQLLVFINDKVKNNEFDMEGRMFSLRANDLQATDVHSVFSNHNWGFNPVIEDDGSLHHKDFEERGNPVRHDEAVDPSITWQELVARERRDRDVRCPFDAAYEPSRETGYLRFLHVPPHLFP